MAVWSFFDCLATVDFSLKLVTKPRRRSKTPPQEKIISLEPQKLYYIDPVSVIKSWIENPVIAANLIKLPRHAAIQIAANDAAIH